MTREELAKRIRWPLIIWLAGCVNVTAMVPQLISIIRTHNVDGLALPMFFIYLGVQIAFSLEGYFTRNRMLMVCLGLSALVNLTNIAFIVVLRYG